MCKCFMQVYVLYSEYIFCYVSYTQIGNIASLSQLIVVQPSPYSHLVESHFASIYMNRVLSAIYVFAVWTSNKSVVIRDCSDYREKHDVSICSNNRLKWFVIQERSSLIFSVCSNLTYSPSFLTPMLLEIQGR